MNSELAKKSLAEFIGTFCMVFIGTGAVVINDLTGAISHLGIALAFGMVVAIMIFSFGNVSGAHINPAVSIAFTMHKSLSVKELPIYILMQVLGAISASLLLLFLFPDSATYGQTNPMGSVAQTFALEVIITFILMIVILKIPDGENKIMNAGVSVGLAVGLLALVVGPVTGASMNPARSIGPALVAGDFTHLWAYILAPILGALLAVFVDRKV